MNDKRQLKTTSKTPVRSSLFISGVFISALFLSACGPFEPIQTKQGADLTGGGNSGAGSGGFGGDSYLEYIQKPYKYENPNSGKKTEMRPVNFEKQAEIKQKYDIELTRPHVEIDFHKKLVLLQITKKVGNGKAEEINLSGHFIDTRKAWLGDTSTIAGKHRMKGVAYCSNSTEDQIDCSEIFVGLRFNHQGQTIHFQDIISPVFDTTPTTQKPAAALEENNDDAANEVPPEEEIDEPQSSIPITEDVEGFIIENDDGSPQEPPTQTKGATHGHSGEEDGALKIENIIEPEMPKGFLDDLAAKNQPQPDVIAPQNALPEIAESLGALKAPAYSFAQTISKPFEASRNNDPYMRNINLSEGGTAFRFYSYFEKKRSLPGKILNTATYMPSQNDCFQRGVGYSDSKAYTTGYTSDFLNQISCDFLKRYPNCGPIVVGNFSAKAGGYLSPHASHQNGLEFDIAYLGLKNLTSAIGFAKKTKTYYFMDSFKTECNLNFIKELANTKLQSGQFAVHKMFTDVNIKKALCSAAKKQKLKDPQMQRAFDVLHSQPTDHHNHLHVRLVCSPKHENCWNDKQYTDEKFNCAL